MCFPLGDAFCNAPAQLQALDRAGPRRVPSVARPLNSRGGSLQAGVIRSGAGRSGGPARAVDADVALMKGFSGASRRLRCPTLLPGMVGMALRVRTGVRETGAAGAAGGVAGAALATGVSRGVTCIITKWLDVDLIEQSFRLNSDLLS
ncbi:hypothetical protein HPB47_012589 [Ixodes persulcatus]|uniref:Uncharacterized protein n=1 Tax=Ixodes persulcatus TaxID=34615 RepID=A0AC60NT61_IXOPE|nr:hypothetical protein HPB47_012589 [Ixodes persulcatus]